MENCGRTELFQLQCPNSKKGIFPFMMHTSIQKAVQVSLQNSVNVRLYYSDAYSICTTILVLYFPAFGSRLKVLSVKEDMICLQNTHGQWIFTFGTAQKKKKI